MRFGVNSSAIFDNPVMFPPGRASVSTSLLPTGSATAINTIGIVLVARWAARAASRVTVNNMSTLIGTSSAARA
jgi:hypothetical protein